MRWEFVIALVIAVPVILFPAAFIWQLNAWGIYAAIKKLRVKQYTRQERSKS